jgi:glycosyltransferase involved in cell wall biosynthesis
MTSPAAPSDRRPDFKDRKPRLLWANAFCLLDTSSGASMSVRQMLLQLVRSGFDVQVLGATIFDHPRGTAGLKGHWEAMQPHRGTFAKIVDGPLEHQLLITAGTSRGQMTSLEEGVWFATYRGVLERFKPDLVFQYGGRPLDFLVSNEARFHGIPVLFYIANGNYKHKRWCRDVDLILTNSRATADLYKRRLGVKPVPVGTFIDPSTVVATHHSRERLLFINPNLEKGAGLVIRLAMMLEKRRPDMVFEVVESRGSWAQLIRQVSKALGDPRERLENVVVTPHTHDMRPIYGRARALLAPSLWWESAGRVLIEAMLNGIPAVVTDRGGMPEVVQDGGIIVKLNSVYHQKPYNRLPPEEELEPVARKLEALYDDADFYARLSAKATMVGQNQHSLSRNTDRLLKALAPLLAKKAGDRD